MTVTLSFLLPATLSSKLDTLVQLLTFNGVCLRKLRAILEQILVNSIPRLILWQPDVHVSRRQIVNVKLERIVGIK